MLLASPPFHNQENNMPRIATKQLTMDRVTKGAVLYSTKNSPDADNGSPITSIYLRKSGMPTENYPATITVTIEADEV